jgi:hypothetical protein
MGDRIPLRGTREKTPHSLTSFVKSAWVFWPIRLLSVVAACAFVAAAAAPAQAHGRLGAAEGRCRLFIGPDIMNFTGYLPEASKNEFCEDIPSTGPMIMVLDAEQAELRDMKVELRIVKDVGGEDRENENLEAVTVAYREPKTYPSGTINFSHTFDDPGYFVGIVTVTGDHGERWVSRFPFSVGKSFMRDLPYYILLALGTIAAFLIWMGHRRLAPEPHLVTAAAAFKPPPPNYDLPTIRDFGAPTQKSGPPAAEAAESEPPQAADPVAENESGRAVESEPGAKAEEKEQEPAKKDDDDHKAVAAE